MLTEVISSPSTAKNDQQSKFMFYRSILSLQHYVLVGSRRMVVGMHSRGAASTWI